MLTTDKKKLKVMFFKSLSLLIPVIICLFLVSWIEKQNDEFIFQKGNQKLTLELDNGKRNLNWNVKTALKLKYENIDPKKVNFSGAGITFLEFDTSKNLTILSITPDKKIIINDTLKLFITGRDLNDSVWVHKFKILIKD